MTERERPQERAHRRRAPSPGTAAPLRCPRSAACRHGRYASRRPRSRAPDVITLRPGRDPPTRPDRRTIEFTIASSPSRTASVPTSNSPALATRFGSSNVTSMRSMACDTRLTESASRVGDCCDFEHRNRRCSGGTFRGYATQLTEVTGGSRLSRRSPRPATRRWLRSRALAPTRGSRLIRSRPGSLPGTRS